LLLADDRFEHIPRLRDVRQIYFGLDAVWIRPRGTRGLRRTGSFAGSPEMDADFLRFMVFKRAGMRLLLGGAHFRQKIENGFTFDFQLPG